MQIITGKYRARKLMSVPSEGTRPTLARVKESVFNLVQDKITGSIALDLFAGSGAFGVECISRGAKKVYFVDKEEIAIKTIKQNTKNMTEDFEILKSDYVSALLNFDKKGVKFNLVYLDPPFKSDFTLNALNLLDKFSLLEDNATIIVEHSGENDLKNLPACYIIEKSKKYGTIYVDVLSYKI